MIRYPPAQLLRLDRRIDRCDKCGGWRFDKCCCLCDDLEERTA
jgi:hypothetical protein